MIIRGAEKNDLPAILEIYNDAILTTTAVYDYEAHTMEMREQWFLEKKLKNIPVLVADIDGQVAGFASYGSFRPWDAYKYSIEHSVYVHKNFRKRGIAKRLLTQLFATAKEREVHTVIAGIDADNKISIELHQRLGFIETGHLKQVGYKFGRWLDLKFYQLILETAFLPNENIKIKES